MAGGETTEQFIFRAQKSTNHLKALLGKLLPAAGGDYGGGAECSASAVDALLSDITDSLSQAITSLRICTVGQPATGTATARSSGQSSKEGGAGGRRPVPRRSGQRLRVDGAAPRMIVLKDEIHDSYTWRKYGQKEILGARFPRSYYRCGRKSGCPAKRHVQQSDADPSKLEIAYFNAHTCHDPPPSSSHFVPHLAVAMDSDAQQRNTALLVPATTVPPALYCVGRPSPSPSHQVLGATTARSNVLSTTGLVPPPVAAVPPALPPSAGYDPVPDDTACTPSLEQEQADLLLHIPSPACSQSDLLPVEAPKLSPRGSSLWLEHTLAWDDGCIELTDFVVPEL